MKGGQEMKPLGFTLFVLLILSAGPAFAQWQTVNSGTSKNLIAGCFITDSVGVIMSSDGTILKTTDKGTTWSIKAALAGNFTSLCSAGSDTLYAGGDHLYRSGDRGNTWSMVSILNPAITGMGFFGSRNGFAIVPGFEYCTEVNTYTLDNYKLYKTTDFGQSWQPDLEHLESSSRLQIVNDNVAYIPGGQYINFPHCGMGWFEHSVRTTNRGVTWNAVFLSDHLGQYSFINQDTGYSVPGVENIIYKTTNGGTTLKSFYSDFGSNSVVKQCKFLNEIDGYFLVDHNISVTSSEGLTWSNDYTSAEVLNQLFDNRAGYLFGIGRNGTIVKKHLVPHLIPDTVYRAKTSPGAVDFGTVNVGNTKNGAFAINNTGNMLVNFLISASNDFRISLDNNTFVTSLQVPVGPNTSANIYVRFHPLLEKLYQDTVFLVAAGLGTIKVPVSGQGYFILTGNITRDTVICTPTLRIGSDITVDPGVRFTICAGTFVDMMGDYRKITVNGVINILGDSLHPVEFGTSDSQFPWKGIYLHQANPDDFSIFNYCNMNLACNNAFLFLDNSKARVRNCNFSNRKSGYAAVFVYGKGSDLEIRNSNIFDNGGAGITCQDIDSIFMKNCNIYGNGTGVDISEAIIPGTLISRAVITGNSIHNNSFLGIDAMSLVYIGGNKIYGNGGGGIRVLHGRSEIFIEKNTVYNNNSTGIEIMYHDNLAYIMQNVIYNNTSLNQNGGGLLLNDAYYHPWIDYVGNNTICNNKVAAGYLGADFYSTNLFSLTNNIIFNVSDTANSVGWDTTVAAQPDYNCFSQRRLSSSGSHNVFANPSFAHPTGFSGSAGNIGDCDWALTAISPCIDTGDQSVGGSISPTDYAGNPRIYDQLIDIGAIEFQGHYAINEQQGTSPVSVFPNPAHGMVNFVAKNDVPLEITLFDIMSVRVLQQQFTKSVSISLGHLTRGVYIYEITNEHGLIQHGKVVKE